MATGPAAPGKDVPLENKDASHWRAAATYHAIGSARCANPRVVYPPQNLSVYNNDYGNSPKWVHEVRPAKRKIGPPANKTQEGDLAYRIHKYGNEIRAALRVIDSKRTGMIHLQKLKTLLSKIAGVSFDTREWAKMLSEPADPTSSGQVRYKTLIEGILLKGGYLGKEAYFRQEGGTWCSDAPKTDPEEESRAKRERQKERLKKKNQGHPRPATAPPARNVGPRNHSSSSCLRLKEP